MFVTIYFFNKKTKQKKPCTNDLKYHGRVNFILYISFFRKVTRDTLSLININITENIINYFWRLLNIFLIIYIYKRPRYVQHRSFYLRSFYTFFFLFCYKHTHKQILSCRLIIENMFLLFIVTNFNYFMKKMKIIYNKILHQSKIQSNNYY